MSKSYRLEITRTKSFYKVISFYALIFFFVLRRQNQHLSDEMNYRHRGVCVSVCVISPHPPTSTDANATHRTAIRPCRAEADGA